MKKMLITLKEIYNLIFFLFGTIVIFSCTNLECDSKDSLKLAESIENFIDQGIYNSTVSVCDSNEYKLIVDIAFHQDNENQYLTNRDLQNMLGSYLLYSKYDIFKKYKLVEYRMYLDKEKDWSINYMIYDNEHVDNVYSVYHKCKLLKEALEYLILNSQESDIYNYNNFIDILSNSVYSDQVIDLSFIDLLGYFLCQEPSQKNHGSIYSKTIRGIFLTMLAEPKEYARELKDINHIYNLVYSESLYERNNFKQ